MPHRDRPVLLTGASGTLGRLLAHRLAALGWPLRLTDRADFPDPLPLNASFTPLDLEDRTAVELLAQDCGLILHFGGLSTEHTFEEILGSNLRGCQVVYEAARINRARVVFASSNHAVGFYDRSTILDHDCHLRPDSFYGLSKAFGELLARLYWEKHAVESVLVRIGSVLPEPPNERILSTWLSPDDFVALIRCCAQADEVGCSVIWGASANSRSFWHRDARAVIGWTPRDSSDAHADQVLGKRTDDPVAEHYQGGVFASANFTRRTLAPAAMFPSLPE